MAKLENIRNAIRFGTVLRQFQWRLERLGIKIEPYYWIQEGVVDSQPPQIKGRPEDYSYGFFDADEMKIIGTLLKYPEDMLISRLKKGMKCLGIKFKGEIAAFMWLDFERCPDQRVNLLLKDHEVYLWDMFTLKPFRGRNIAPNLRYYSYETLKIMGRKTFYSITEYFNSPALQFKKKLNARFLWLGINVTLFNKYKRHWIIKKYRY